MSQQEPKKSRVRVWFERIERAVHRVRQQDGLLTNADTTLRSVVADVEGTASGTSEDRQDGPRTYMRTPNARGSAGGVLVEVAKLRSLTAGTSYDDELEAVLRDYPNLANLYDSSG